MVWVSAKRQERKPHVDGRMPHNNDQLNGPKAELCCRCRRQPKPNQSFFYELTKLFLLLVNSRVNCTSPVLHTDGSGGEWGWDIEKDHLSRLSLQWDAAPAFYCCQLQRCSRKSLLQFPLQPFATPPPSLGPPCYVMQCCSPAELWQAKSSAFLDAFLGSAFCIQQLPTAERYLFFIGYLREDPLTLSIYIYYNL